MSKNVSFVDYLLGVGSYLSIFTIFMIAFSVLAPAHAETMSDEVQVDKAGYETYTLSVAASGQRFSVGL